MVSSLAGVIMYCRDLGRIFVNKIGSKEKLDDFVGDVLSAVMCGDLKVRDRK